MLILTGPPGSGKTTVARLLAARYTRAVHLESDRFFQFITSGYVQPWKPESHGQNRTVMQIVASAAAGYAFAGYFTIIDGIVSPRWFLQPLSEGLEASGQSVAYVVLRAPLETCLTRAVGRRDDPLNQRAAIEQLWNEFADLGEYEDHVLANEGSTPDQIAELIAAQLGSKLLLHRGR